MPNVEIKDTYDMEGMLLNISYALKLMSPSRELLIVNTKIDEARLWLREFKEKTL